MKNFPVMLFMAIITFLSCNNEPKQSAEKTDGEDTTKPGEIKVMIPDMFCYSVATDKDSIFLKTEIFPNVVTGNLSYKLYEKDGNEGTIDGTLKGDTLLADYTFMSEGKSSVRQVAFLIKDNTAREGYGDMEEKEGRMIFKNLRELDFSNSISLRKMECPVQ